jgi:hypothetical protein
LRRIVDLKNRRGYLGTRAWQVDSDLPIDATWLTAHDDDPVREGNSLVNIVHDQDQREARPLPQGPNMILQFHAREAVMRSDLA